LGKTDCWVLFLMFNYSGVFLVYVHFLKNDIISSGRKRYCALGLEFRIRFSARVSGNTFSVKRVFEQL